MVSTGIYVRVSTEEQAREGYSIRAQEEKLRTYAGLKDWHIYSVYADEGISGKNIEERPAIGIILKSTSRGSRCSGSSGGYSSGIKTIINGRSCIVRRS